MGDALSEEKEQEVGLRQDCLLPVTRSNIKINDIVKKIKSGTKYALYVDD